MSRRHTFVTVAFEGDLRLMDLQARSMGLYCDASLAEEVIVVDNFAPGAKPPNWAETLTALYGPLGALVRIVPAAEVTDLADAGGGWIAQQALKLAIARQVHGDFYVVLDAKNHLVRPLLREFIEAPDGRPRINGYGYAQSHPLYDSLVRTCHFCHIDLAAAAARFVRTSTPFVMITASVRAQLDGLGATAGEPIGAVLKRWAITEFFLYAGALASVGMLERAYAWDQPFTADVWKWGAPDDVLVAKTLDKAMSPDFGPFLALHRAAIPLLSPASRANVADLWARRALVSSRQEGLELLSSPM